MIVHILLTFGVFVWLAGCGYGAYLSIEPLRREEWGLVFILTIALAVLSGLCLVGLAGLLCFIWSL